MSNYSFFDFQPYIDFEIWPLKFTGLDPCDSFGLLVYNWIEKKIAFLFPYFSKFT